MFSWETYEFFRTATGGVLLKKLVLKILQYSQESCRAATLLKKTPIQMFSSEYCEIFKNTYFEEHLLTAVSDFLKQLQNNDKQLLLYWLFH